MKIGNHNFPTFNRNSFFLRKGELSYAFCRTHELSLSNVTLLFIIEKLIGILRLIFSLAR